MDESTALELSDRVALDVSDENDGKRRHRRRAVRTRASDAMPVEECGRLRYALARIGDFIGAWKHAGWRYALRRRDSYIDGPDLPVETPTVPVEVFYQEMGAMAPGNWGCVATFTYVASTPPEEICEDVFRILNSQGNYPQHAHLRPMTAGDLVLIAGAAWTCGPAGWEAPGAASPEFETRRVNNLLARGMTAGDILTHTLRPNRPLVIGLLGERESPEALEAGRACYEGRCVCRGEGCPQYAIGFAVAELEVTSHDCKAAGCGPYCTAFEW